MPIWPGEPGIEMVPVKEIEKGARSNVSRLTMSTHTGTHVDAPRHFFADGATVEQLSLRELTGRVYILYLPKIDVITKEILKQAVIPPRTRRILFKTRNSDYWVNKKSDFQTNYVAISSDAAQYLVDRNIKLVGVDYLSVAPYDDTITTHQILLTANVIIVEGLNLSKVPPGRYTLYCLPLKLAGADGAPARVILIGV
jgi:arylformamidase